MKELEKTMCKVEQIVDKIMNLMQDEGITQGEAELIQNRLSRRMQENRKAQAFTVVQEGQRSKRSCIQGISVEIDAIPGEAIHDTHREEVRKK